MDWGGGYSFGMICPGSLMNVILVGSGAGVGLDMMGTCDVLYRIGRDTCSDIETLQWLHASLLQH